MTTMSRDMNADTPNSDVSGRSDTSRENGCGSESDNHLWIEVTTASRLHFGLLSVQASGQRQFGGLGMMIDRPRSRIRLRASAQDIVRGPDTDRVHVILERLRASSTQGSHDPSLAARHSTRAPGRVSVGRDPRAGVQIEVCEAIPAHCGLGSGTQLALAVAQGLQLLWTARVGDPVGLSQSLARCARSAIGTHGARWGGFLVDGGRGPAQPAPLITRLPVPDTWRILLVCPRIPAGERVGLSGERERAAFRALPGMEPNRTQRLCALALLEILPALAESDFSGFSRALGEYGRLVGEYFAPVQDGLVAHPEMSRLIELLRERGHHGLGQSSWGPAIWICSDSAAAAESLAAEIAEVIDRAHWTVTVSAPCNSGMRLVRGTESQLQRGTAEILTPTETEQPLGPGLG